jgi:hypothetical protein
MLVVRCLTLVEGGPCGLASRLGYLALIAYPVAVTFLLLDRLLCPALITISYGLRCQLANNRRSGL